MGQKWTYEKARNAGGRLFKRRTLAPDFDCIIRFRCTAAELTIYPPAQLDRNPLARVDSLI